MKQVIFVSHCILNTAAKVVLYNQDEIDAEEALRRRFLDKAILAGVQIIQLPCPEFTLYGARRWGHVSNQFDNVFFREHSRKILAPVIAQLKEYLQNDDFFEVLGIVGVDGSPSCGVDYTCFADWYGSFDGREGLDETLASCKLIKKKGIFMDVLSEMLKDEGLTAKVNLTSLYAPEPEKCLCLIK